MMGEMPEAARLAAVFGLVVAAALMLIRPALGLRPGKASRRWDVSSVWSSLRRGSGGRGAELRGDAAVLLRQFSALLQSGRGEAQAWADLRDHWRRRSPLPARTVLGRTVLERPVPERAAQGEDHPLAAICAQVAASEQLGQGTAAGLRRCVQEMSGKAEPDVLRLLEQLIAVTALSEQTGAPLSRLVEQLAAGLDESSELHAAVRAAAAGPKLTQLVLALLPLGGVGLGQLMGVSPLATLAGTPLGWLCLVAGVFLLAIGWWWSSRLIQGVMRHV